MVALGNCEYVGGGVHMLPGAVLNDGLLDICLVLEASIPQRLNAFPLFYRGKHLNHPRCLFFQGQEIKIDFEGNEQIPIHVDGQILATESLRVKNISQALQVIIPSAKGE